MSLCSSSVWETITENIEIDAKPLLLLKDCNYPLMMDATLLEALLEMYTKWIPPEFRLELLPATVKELIQTDSVVSEQNNMFLVKEILQVSVFALQCTIS